ANGLVVLRRAGEPVRPWIRGDARGGPARRRRPELRENGAAELAERDDQDGDEDDDERRAAHDGRDPIKGRAVCHYAVGVARFAAMRSGDHYLASLDDGRVVFLDGERVGDDVVRFYERARDEDLYVAYGIVPLQIDRSQPAHRQPQPFLYPGVAAERDGGIVVRGAQGITTAAVLADWLFISYITPL